ncbi:MAG TPA: ADP-ribosylglycohydrolase family protein [Gemmatimonadales bacterium]|nr:ADP-ribosylglycohydrolase family protein [Gemmatimonadales bacterium]
MSPSPDQRAGCLLGLALGDALGFVVEAEPPEVARRHAAALRAGRGAERSHSRFPFGQYSDDTQLSRELLISIREARGFSPEAFGRRVAALFASGRDVGAGPGTRGAALRLAAGVSWRDAGAPSPYAGNGSAMRAAPIGVLIGAEGDELSRVAVEQSRVTHHDPRCAAGALAMAAAARAAARPGPIDPAAWVSEVAAVVRPFDEGVARAIELAGGWVSLRPADAHAALTAAELDPGSPGGALGISAHVVPTVGWAVYSFLRCPDSFSEAVAVAIEVGGDTDTMGAMAGALVGARVGRRGLPAELLDRVNDRGRWGAGALARLAGVSLV